MAAYGSAVSLMNTLCKMQPQIGALFRAVRFLKRFLVANNAEFETQIQVEALFKAVNSLRCFLEDNRAVKAEFETRIRDAIYEAQDIIDAHTWSAHFLSPSEAEISSNSFHEDLERVTQKINSIAQMTTQEFNHLTLDRKISTSIWRHIGEIYCIRRTDPVVGRDEDINELKDRLLNGSDALQVVPIVGVAGMGKTALARWLLKDPMIVNHFDAIGWVKVSVKCSKRDKLLDILASLRKSSIRIPGGVDGPDEDEYNWSDEIQQMSEEQLVKQINNSLKHKRYIIVLDDIRDAASWNDLKELFLDYHNGSRILLTTRDVEVAPARPHLLDRLSDEAALVLLEVTVFDGEPCPAHLAIIAKDIACNCRGLPHAVLIVGKLLSCANPIAEYWEIVLSSIISMDNDDDLIQALLSLTYNHLPQHLRVCLLYMAIFPYNYAIPWMKLLIQWIIEGFVGEVESLRTFTKAVYSTYDHLLGVSARSCTRNIFERIPCLFELNVRIESSQEDESLSFFSYLQILDVLCSFKCIVIYPDIGSSPPVPVFPSLAFLTLNGCGFPWDYMRVIAALPELECLTLQNYAFQGPDWEMKTGEFRKLTNLVLEDMDLENWTFDSSTGSIFPTLKSLITGNWYKRWHNWTFDSSTGSIFPVLDTLIIRNCYKLRHIPSVIADSSTLGLFEVVDCSASARVAIDPNRMQPIVRNIC